MLAELCPAFESQGPETSPGRVLGLLLAMTVATCPVCNVGSLILSTVLVYDDILFASDK